MSVCKYQNSFNEVLDKIKSINEKLGIKQEENAPANHVDVIVLLLTSLESIEEKIGAQTSDYSKEALKKDVEDFMLSHFNVKWLNDDIERSAYDAIIEFLWNATPIGSLFKLIEN